jgi:hypothetical protein
LGDPASVPLIFSGPMVNLATFPGDVLFKLAVGIVSTFGKKELLQIRKKNHGEHKIPDTETRLWWQPALFFGRSPKPK